MVELSNILLKSRREITLRQNVSQFTEHLICLPSLYIETKMFFSKTRSGQPTHFYNVSTLKNLSKLLFKNKKAKVLVILGIFVLNVCPHWIVMVKHCTLQEGIEQFGVMKSFYHEPVAVLGCDCKGTCLDCDLSSCFIWKWFWICISQVSETMMRGPWWQACNISKVLNKSQHFSVELQVYFLGSPDKAIFISCLGHACHLFPMWL